MSAVAIVEGKPITELPEDLYIPPDALEIILETFEGPLDVLLYLIRRHNLDILNIPIADITSQYMEYVDLMKSLKLELAGEYLLMAAMLAEIKSRMLLPRPAELEEEGGDPRAELIRRLQEYEQIKTAAEEIEELPREERDFYVSEIKGPDLKKARPLPDVDLKEVLMAMKDVMSRVEQFASHHVSHEALSVRERMTNMLEQIKGQDHVPFIALFTLEEGRAGVVVTFIAMLELLKQSMIEIVQTETFGQIYLKTIQVCQEDNL